MSQYRYLHQHMIGCHRYDEGSSESCWDELTSIYSRKEKEDILSRAIVVPKEENEKTQAPRELSKEEAEKLLKEIESNTHNKGMYDCWQYFCQSQRFQDKHGTTFEIEGIKRTMVSGGSLCDSKTGEIKKVYPGKYMACMLLIKIL
jgi:hypothetical protein